MRGHRRPAHDHFLGAFGNPRRVAYGEKEKAVRKPASITMPTRHFMYLVSQAVVLSPECAAVMMKLEFIDWANIPMIMRAVEYVRAATPMPMDRWIKFLSYMPESLEKYCDAQTLDGRCTDISRLLGFTEEETAAADEVCIDVKDFSLLAAFAVCGHTPISEESARFWAIKHQQQIAPSRIVVALANITAPASDMVGRRTQFLAPLPPQIAARTWRAMAIKFV